MFHRPEVEFQSSLASWYWTSQEEAIWARRRPTMLHTWIPPLTKDRKGWSILIKLWDSSHMHESKDFYKARIVSKTESPRLNKVKVKLLSHVRLSATPWTVAYQASPSMGFPRQEYWSGVPLPSLEIIWHVLNSVYFSGPFSPFMECPLVLFAPPSCSVFYLIQ